MGKRIRKTNRRSNLRKLSKNKKRKSMKRKSMKRRNNRRKTMLRKNSRRNFLRGGMKSSAGAASAQAASEQAASEQAAAEAEAAFAQAARVAELSEAAGLEAVESVKGHEQQQSDGSMLSQAAEPVHEVAPIDPTNTIGIPPDSYDKNGIKLVRFGDVNNRKLVEIGSKPLLNGKMEYKDMDALLKDAHGVFVPAELKREGEPASNFRSTDARIIGAGWETVNSDGIRIATTRTNDEVISNIKKLFKSDVPYFQSSLPRKARVFKTGSISFSGDYDTTTVNMVNRKKKTHHRRPVCKGRSGRKSP